MNWMRQKTEAGAPETTSADRRTTSGAVAPGGRVNIGSSMQIKGELTGSEDLVIDGKVEGKIFLNGHKLTVGKNGLITAEIRDARSVVIHGEIRGNITATDRVEVADSGSMQGDIRAPRVVLADGARFRGGIDMEPKAPAAAKAAEAKPEPASKGGEESKGQRKVAATPPGGPGREARVDP